MSVAQVCGWVAVAGAVAMWLPQLLRLLRGHPPHGLSSAGFALGVAFNAVLCAYGLLNGAVQVTVAACSNLACTLAIGAVARRAR